MVAADVEVDEAALRELLILTTLLLPAESCMPVA